MPETVKLPSHLYARLASHAHGFDTPANVIERLLDAYEGVQAGAATAPPESSANGDAHDGSRNYAKYVFGSREYGKGRLVLAVITEHAASRPGMTMRGLAEDFPKSLQGSHGVFDTEDEAREIFGRTGIKRHFIKANELIRLEDGVIAVSTQWGIGNIHKFIEHARSHGYEITGK